MWENRTPSPYTELHCDAETNTALSPTFVEIWCSDYLRLPHQMWTLYPQTPQQALHAVVCSSASYTHLPRFSASPFARGDRKHTGHLCETCYPCCDLANSLTEMALSRGCDSPNLPVGKRVGKHNTSKCFNLLLIASSCTSISLYW